MNRNMYKERALFKFRRFYMHGVRNDKDYETSVNEAMFRTRDEVLTEIKCDPEIKTNAEREDIWSDILEDLMIFRNMLKDIPIDKERLEEMRDKRLQEEKEIEERVIGISGSSELVATALVAGLEQFADKEGGKDGPNKPKS